MNPKPYIPRPWQLPHLLATPIGGTVLMVEWCKYPVEEDGDWIWFVLPDGSRIGQHEDDDFARHRLAKARCPLGTVGTVLACKETWAYITDHDGQYLFPASKKCLYRIDCDYMASRWRPSTAMPMAFCRLFFRTTSIDLRRVDTMTPHEANLWGVKAELDRDGTDADRLIAVVTEQEAAKERYLADNPGATWGEWAWFIQAERVERACSQ